MAPSEHMSRKDAAHYCGVSEKTFIRHVAPYVRRVPIGSLVRYARRDVEAWIRSQTIEPERVIAENIEDPFVLVADELTQRRAANSEGAYAATLRARAERSRLREAG